MTRNSENEQLDQPAVSLLILLKNLTTIQSPHNSRYTERHTINFISGGRGKQGLSAFLLHFPRLKTMKVCVSIGAMLVFF